MVDQALQLLRDDLEQKQFASEAFPPVLTRAQIRSSVSRYEEHIKAAAKCKLNIYKTKQNITQV
jgi:hypothetical protein